LASVKCGEPGHRSNECPKKKQVNMTDYKDDGEEEAEIEDPMIQTLPKSKETL